MGTAFSNALSGLTANSLAIDAVSGNLANMNTSGYKANQVSFEDLVNESLGGAASSSQVGGTLAKTSQAFSQGSTTSTDQPFDAAIQGNGFFVLQNAAGQQLFTRAGNFTLDSTGNLLTQAGDHVEGWMGANGIVNTNAVPGNIVLPVAGLRPPTASTAFSLNVNLNANAAAGTPDATFSSPLQVVDSLGKTHVLTVTYTESATTPGSWDYAVNIPAADQTTASTTALATGTLTFDANGILKSPAATDTATKVSVTGLADGAADLDLTWNLYDAKGQPQITQYDQASANLANSQDGTQAGQLTGVSIGAQGQVLAAYSNGDSVALAQLALGSVLNPESMQDLGNNTFGVTSATSKPVFGASGTGSLGTIKGGALESSTVDIAKEFTNLLVYERGYQANSKVITTEDQVVQQTLAMITG